MKRLCVFGESPLLEEYASLCLNKGLEVHGRLNAIPASAKQLPRTVRKTARPLRTTDIALELTTTSAEMKRKNLVELDAALAARVPILSSSVTCLLAEQASWLRHPARLVGIGALPSLLEGGVVEVTRTSVTDPGAIQKAGEFFSRIGKDQAPVGDAVGMVLPRILCALVNEAYFAMLEGVASAREIDTAMRLGTNYPRGPVEWGDRIGLVQVHAVLKALHGFYGEERYRPAPALVHALRNRLIGEGV